MKYLCDEAKTRLTPNAMSLFDTLLTKRDLTRAPIPLWKLKVTDDEYEELKETIYRVATAPYGAAGFRTIERECALLFSEYWRRDYIDGPHKLQAVYDVLKKDPKVPSSFYNNFDSFYEAAKRGARRLGIDFYQGDTTQYLDSMFYQGGLPMRLVTLNAKNSVWDRFTRGLVHRHIDFEDLQLGKVATVSQSLREYSAALVDAIDKGQFRLMPFYCKDETDPWFRSLMALAHQERIIQRLLRPFSLDWEFDVDQRGGSFTTKYVVRGLQRLPEAFLEAQQLANETFFSAQVRVDGKAVDTFDYQNRFCRYNVLSKHPYHEGEVVSVYLHDRQHPLLSDDLDLGVPHLLYRDKDGKYFLGNKMGSVLSLLLVPEGWTVDDESFEVKDLTWEGKICKGVFIREDFQGKISVHGTDGEIVFGADARLYWSEIASSPLYLPDIIEPVYDAASLRLSLCSDGDSAGITVKENEVEYRSKGEITWSPTPSYGEIMARVKDRDGVFVTPVKFLNVGELSVTPLKADKDRCSIKVSWPHGRVFCEEGVKKSSGAWEIEKNSCADSRRIHFRFVPTGHSRAQFTLTLRAPFKDFSILDADGVPVLDSSIVPYGDLDKYQYHLVGQGIKGYSYGNTRRELRWEADKLYVYEDGRMLRRIPYEGSLLTLFDSREVVRTLLDKTAKSILAASLRVDVEIDTHRRMVLLVKDSPYRIHQVSEKELTIRDEWNNPIRYPHALKLFNLDDPTEPRVSLPFSEDNGFVLPEGVASWKKILATGRTRGRILPALIDPEKAPSQQERMAARREAMDRISKEIDEGKLGGDTWNRIVGWFNLSQAEDIPASSILELYCLSRDGRALLTLAFQLFLNCKGEEDLDTLTGQLLSMGTDLAFQWYWVRPQSEHLMMTIQNVINWNSPFLKTLYVDWAISRQHDLAEVMYDISDDDVFSNKLMVCMGDVLGQFDLWLKDLYAASILDIYGTVNEPILREVAGSIAGKSRCLHIESHDEVFVEQNQNLDDPEVNAFFDRFDEPGRPRNERWLIQRVNAVAAHLKNELDLFKASHEVRRSIVFCRKTSPKAFLIELNNKLSQ